MTLTSSTTATSTNSSTADVDASVELVEVKPGKRFSLALLRDILPDTETALFFGKVYELDAQQLGNLLHLVLDSDLASALFGESGSHSTDLQDYLGGLDLGPEDFDDVRFGDESDTVIVPKGEILPQVWESLEIEVAKSIKEVAAKLEHTIHLLPGKQAKMVFGSMRVLNNKRPTIGDFRASIQHHQQQKENLLILDVSGSMSAGTISRIIEDVISLSYVANAHLAIVSNTCTYWAPGTYSVADVLKECEYGGTCYDQLAPLFDDKEWGTVITVADYDSYTEARSVLRRCTGTVDLVLDISLVNRPTYLAECIGERATEVRPILIANTRNVLAS